MNVDVVSYLRENWENWNTEVDGKILNISSVLTYLTTFVPSVFR